MKRFFCTIYVCLLLIVLTFTSCKSPADEHTQDTSASQLVTETFDTTVSDISITADAKNDTSYAQPDIVSSTTANTYYETNTSIHKIPKESTQNTTYAGNQTIAAETQTKGGSDKETNYTYSYIGTNDDTHLTTSTSIQAASTTTLDTKRETAVTTTESIMQKEFPPLTPLSTEEQMKIKEDFDVFKADEWPESEIEDLNILSYYGTYNGCEVVEISSSLYPVSEALKKVTVGEYGIIVSSFDLEIYLHKDSDFIDIYTAYSEGYLNDDDIEAIYYYSKSYLHEDEVDVIIDIN